MDSSLLHRRCAGESEKSEYSIPVIITDRDFKVIKMIIFYLSACAAGARKGSRREDLGRGKNAKELDGKGSLPMRKTIFPRASCAPKSSYFLSHL